MSHLIQFLITFFSLFLILFFCIAFFILIRIDDSLIKKAKKFQTEHLFLFPVLLYSYFIVFSLSFFYVIVNLFEIHFSKSLASSFVTIIGADMILIITLTFIIVQLHSQNYTFRVLELLKNYWDFWILISTQLLFLLCEISISDTGNEFLILFFGITPIILILPYIHNIIVYIRPENLINRLMQRIAEKGENEWILQNELQSIFDIIIGSIRKGDLRTAKDGLHKLNGTNPLDGLENGRNQIKGACLKEANNNLHPLTEIIQDSLLMIKQMYTSETLEIFYRNEGLGELVSDLSNKYFSLSNK